MSDYSAKKKDAMPDLQKQALIFRVATFNVENYLDDTASRCCVKSAASKAKVRECIRALHPDVLALQEMGSVAALLELRAALQAEGLDFPLWQHVTGSDADVHLAILSRFPFSARRPHTDDSFELGGQRFRVRRGFAEVGVQVNPGCQFTLLAAHLKSKNEVPDGDAAGLRLEEAKLLRSKIDALLVLNCIDRRYNICQPGACPEPHARLLAVRRTAKS
jgi:endonuclease/exonuclease/phosphatase family metal-dependent hydrolase